MRTYFRHIFEVLKKRNCSFPKGALIGAYVRMLMNAYVSARISPRTQHGHRFNFLGYTVHFPNYPEFIFLFEEIFLKEVYRTQTTPSSIIDCGSNIGMSILYFKLRNPHCAIEAFEPDSDNYSFLMRNLRANGLQNVTPHCVALWRETKELDVYKSIDAGKNSLNPTLKVPGEDKLTCRVPAVRLSDYITKTVELVKIDVEGAEVEILEDLFSSGRIDEVNSLALEYHEAIVGKPLGDLIINLQAHGLHCEQDSRYASVKGAEDPIIICTRQVDQQARP